MREVVGREDEDFSEGMRLRQVVPADVCHPWVRVQNVKREAHRVGWGRCGGRNGRFLREESHERDTQRWGREGGRE